MAERCSLGTPDNIRAYKISEAVPGDILIVEAEQIELVRPSLMEEMHKRGMKVILDGVFNHCGSFNKWMDRERIYERSRSIRRALM